MPTFMILHDVFTLSPPATRHNTTDSADGQIDEFGVRQVQLLHNSRGGVYRVLEAPDAGAVRNHYKALGISSGEVHEVSARR
jgi:hypothetical protein